MNDKCEWKGIQEGNKPARWELWQCDKRPFLDSIPLTEWDFCPYCGADIRKPEPAESKNVYLFINGEKFVIDCNDTTKKVEKNIAEIITRETGMLAKVEITEPLKDPEEELFEKWWNDNLASQPPLIDLSDSPQMIAKKYCRIGFLGCYYKLQDQK